ncbi:minor capsid protein [Ligilactobacillus salivarius]|uniref:Phage head morphogenesis domain-containing protein n=1 Tax=Ligilactobacillus salivarius TaxID=1624 RepID=A0A1Y0F8H0_9LACO|nr:minor capsid protein [Ligilactobacillus salivarius]ARU19621.1 hypothetical protein B7R82_06300 [Ligilactobacillus salivarius]
MLSKSKMQKILKEIYGANLIDRQTLDRLFNSSEKEILGYLMSFIADDSNWSGKANKDDIEEIQAELNELSKDNNLVPLVSVMIANLQNATAGDVLQARISLPLIKVAQQQHRMIDNVTTDVPKLLSKYSKLQAQEMPNNHKVPPNYDELLTKMIRNSWDEAHLSINRDINYTIQRIKQVAKQAASATDDNLNYAKRIDKILTGGKVGNGASGRAQSIIRTFTSRALNETTFASYKARGIQYYRFLALESNTCTECQSMDGKIFKVDDATEGINRPPIHINCQCWTVPIENTNFISGSEILYQRFSGAIMDDGNLDETTIDNIFKREKIAKDYYSQLRNSDRNELINKIVASSGVDKKIVKEALKHVLDSKYDLINPETFKIEKQHFYPDYDMAHSFSRLINNNAKNYDIIMLKHEALEAFYMDKKAMSYEEAHNKANMKYNYQDSIER